MTDEFFMPYLCALNCTRRSMALAAAILSASGVRGPLAELVGRSPLAGLRILEINPVCDSTSTLNGALGHCTLEYPGNDLSGLSFDEGAWDLVVGSETYHHVSDPVAALAECRQMIGAEVRCVFTVPIVWERLGHSRARFEPSHHGNAADVTSDLLVYTEFGADAWATVVCAGFSACTLHCLEFPAGLAIEAGTPHHERHSPLRGTDR